MSDAAKTLAELRKLSVEERLQLVGDLWDSIDEDTIANSFPTDPEFIAELERRFEEMERDPHASISVEKLISTLRNLPTRRAR
jgi:putative addiction module component (TIGR02574 family)